MSIEHSSVRQTGNRVCFTIPEFCEAHRISRSKLYEMWDAGTGPRFMRVGAKVLITTESAADWRRACEALTAGEGA